MASNQLSWTGMTSLGEIGKPVISVWHGQHQNEIFIDRNTKQHLPFLDIHNFSL